MDVTKVSTTTLVLNNEELETVCVALCMLRKQRAGQPHPALGASSPLTTEEIDKARKLHMQLVEDDDFF